MEYRLEHDTMGEVRVPADRYWGAQTQRSYENFRIGTEKIPPEVIRAFAVVKLAAARANAQLGVLAAPAPSRLPATRSSTARSTATSRSPSGRPAAARRRI